MGTIALSPDGNTLTINGYEFKRETSSEGDLVFTYSKGTLDFNTYHIKIKDGAVEFGLNDASYKKIVDLGSVNSSYLWWANKDSAGAHDLIDTQKSILRTTARIASSAPTSLENVTIEGTSFSVTQEPGRKTFSFPSTSTIHTGQRFYYDGATMWGIDPRINDGKPVDLSDVENQTRFSLSNLDQSLLAQAVEKSIQNDKDAAANADANVARKEMDARLRIAQQAVGDKNRAPLSTLPTPVFNGNATVQQYESRRDTGTNGAASRIFGGASNQRLVSSQLTVKAAGIDVPGAGHLEPNVYEQIPDKRGVQHYYEHSGGTPSGALQAIADDDPRLKVIAAAYQQTVVDEQFAQKIQEREDKGEGKPYDLGDGRTLTTYGNQGRRLDIGPEGDARVTLHDLNGHVYKEQTNGGKRAFKELKGEHAAKARIQFAQADRAARAQNPDLDRDGFNISVVGVPGTDKATPLQWKKDGDSILFALPGKDAIFIKEHGKIYGPDGVALDSKDKDTKTMSDMLTEAIKDKPSSEEKITDARGRVVGAYEDHSDAKFPYDSVRLDRPLTVDGMTYPRGTYLRTDEGITLYKDNDFSKKGKTYPDDGSPQSKQLDTMFGYAGSGGRKSAADLGIDVTSQGTFSAINYNGDGDKWAVAKMPTPDGKGTVTGTIIHVSESDAAATVKSGRKMPGREKGDYFVVHDERYPGEKGQVYKVSRDPAGGLAYERVKDDALKGYMKTLYDLAHGYDSKNTGDGLFGRKGDFFSGFGDHARKPFTEKGSEFFEGRRGKSFDGDPPRPGYKRSIDFSGDGRGRSFSGMKTTYGASAGAVEEAPFGGQVIKTSFDMSSPGQSGLYVPVSETGNRGSLRLYTANAAGTPEPGKAEAFVAKVDSSTAKPNGAPATKAAAQPLFA